jgi:ABC-type polysaccharide/polyol phosphate export permease
VRANDLSTLWQYRDLVRRLVGRDLRLKYKGSTLGFGWSLLNPLLMAAVYTAAFRYVLRIEVAHFPLFLLSGLLPWTFHANALTSAAGAVVDAGPLVRKVAFPRAALPVSAVGTQFVQFGLMFAVVVPLLAAGGPGLSLAMAAAVPLALLLAGFVLGLGLLAARWYVFHRDVRHLLEVALQIWFWLTPIVYPVSLVPERARDLVWLNPMALFAVAFQDAAVHQSVPSAATWLVLTLMAVTSLTLGLVVFARGSRHFAELV